MEVINYKDYLAAVLTQFPLRPGTDPSGWIDGILAHTAYKAPMVPFFQITPEVSPAQNSDGWVHFSSIVGKSESHQELVRRYFQQLMPWRKGPFQIDGIPIDAEWDCRVKWNRFESKLPDLTGQTVLDVGANNGYYLFRLAEKKAVRVLGIDPHPLYFKQFLALNQWLPQPSNIQFLPIGYESLPQLESQFDLILLMGILYHEKNPLLSLQLIKEKLKTKGKLIVESIVIPGDASTVLFPRGRYAQMKNVYFIPSVGALESWLFKTGFKSVELLSVSTTNSDEQRVTPWSSAASLDDFLDPQDKSQTIEGYPAPERAVMIATI